MQREKPIMTYNPKKILNIDVELGDRFSVLEKIGQGSFGDIYKVFDKQRNQLGAVKLERKDKKSPLGMLLKEAQILYDLRNSEYYPKLIEASQHKDYNYLIMQFLGPNLENIKRKQNNQMSLKTVLLIGIQMIQNLENLHNHKYIHRDIKPENFVIGTDGNHHNVYLIDFGLSKKYIDDSGRHIPFSENKGLVGTARYTSINSHIGTEQSRRDDLEGLGYILIYFAKKQLPWQNLNCQNRNEKFKKIQQFKVKTTLPDLCADLPSEFVEYFQHIKSLPFTQKPDYSLLKGLFLKVLQKNYVDEKFCYDWCKTDCPINMNSQIKQSVIECRKNTKFDLEKLQKKVDSQMYQSMFLSSNANKKTATQSLQTKANSEQLNQFENTDFTDIDERKNGENQIKLPYIDKTYSVRMSIMNFSQINSNSNNNINLSKLIKNQKNNQISIGQSQFYPQSNSDSKILFYGADTSNALQGYNSTRISKLNFDTQFENDSKNQKIHQSNILNKENSLNQNQNQNNNNGNNGNLNVNNQNCNQNFPKNGKNNLNNSFSNELDIQDENNVGQQLLSNNQSRLELGTKKLTNQFNNVNNQSMNVNLGSFSNNYNNPSRINSQSNFNNPKSNYQNMYQPQEQIIEQNQDLEQQL